MSGKSGYPVFFGLDTHMLKERELNSLVLSDLSWAYLLSCVSDARDRLF